MGVGLSLLAIYELGRASVLTLADVAARRLTRDVVDDRLQDTCARIVAHARIQLTVVGADRVPRGRAFVYMSNHQSHLDIPVLYSSIPTRTLRMVAKTELFRVPAFGPAIRAAEFVEVDREKRGEAIASLDRARDAIADGVSIWIAPEGTRSPDGTLAPLDKLKKGGFHLAVGAAAPIIPVAIRGTNAVLPPGGINLTPGLPVSVEIGDPIPVDGVTVSDLMARVHAFLADRV